MQLSGLKWRRVDRTGELRAMMGGGACIVNAMTVLQAESTVAVKTNSKCVSFLLHLNSPTDGC